MHNLTRFRKSLVKVLLIGVVILSACSSQSPLVRSTFISTIPAKVAPISSVIPTPITIPAWFNIKMTNVLTGQTFSISDFTGKVVLLETMAEWCGTCAEQQYEVKKLEGLTGNSKDLILISLDTDPNEDAASLKKYAAAYGLDWYFAISPLEVDRALGNLYDVEFMTNISLDAAIPRKYKPSPWLVRIH